MEIVSLTGFRELDAALGDLPKATAKNVLKRTLMKAGKPVEDAAQENAPKESGTLDHSIIEGTQLTKRQRGDSPVLTSDGFRSASKNYVEVYIGTALSRGMFTNFGTFKDAPQLWFDRAWASTQNETLEIIKADLGSEIEKAAARYARKLAKGS